MSLFPPYCRWIWVPQSYWHILKWILGNLGMCSLKIVNFKRCFIGDDRNSLFKEVTTQVHLSVTCVLRTQLALLSLILGMISSAFMLSLSWNWIAFCIVLMQRTFRCWLLGSSSSGFFLPLRRISLASCPWQSFKLCQRHIECYHSKAHWVLWSCLLTQNLIIKFWFWFPFSKIVFSLQRRFVFYYSNSVHPKSYPCL